ncbi:MAG: hypothetical protein ACYTCN_08705, partial [Planctomycetota bacterium]
AGAQAPRSRDSVESDTEAASPTAKQSLTVPPNKRIAIKLTLDIAKESVQRKAIQYDGTGDTHYDLASAYRSRCAALTPTRRCIGWHE